MAEICRDSEEYYDGLVATSCTHVRWIPNTIYYILTNSNFSSTHTSGKQTGYTDKTAAA